MKKLFLIFARKFQRIAPPYNLRGISPKTSFESNLKKNQFKKNERALKLQKQAITYFIFY